MDNCCILWFYFDKIDFEIYALIQILDVRKVCLKILLRTFWIMLIIYCIAVMNHIGLRVATRSGQLFFCFFSFSFCSEKLITNCLRIWFCNKLFFQALRPSSRDGNDLLNSDTSGSSESTNQEKAEGERWRKGTISPPFM